MDGWCWCLAGWLAQYVYLTYNCEKLLRLAGGNIKKRVSVTKFYRYN